MLKDWKYKFILKFSENNNNLNKSHLTAIDRKRISSPTQYLLNAGLLKGKILDYGCGKAFDAKSIDSDYFDPYYYPEGIKNTQYDTIICNYVLNVIKDENERKKVVDNIISLLSNDGKAYISVRNDIKNLKGETSKGTWQGLIVLDFPVLTENSTFKIYEITKK